jgi:hypothetical protein
VIVPGTKPLDLNNWLLATDPAGQLPPGRGSSPEAVSILSVMDVANRPVPDQQRLATDLATVFSLALNRRIDIPHDIAFQVKGSEGRVTMAPYGQAIDRLVLGPLPDNVTGALSDILSHVAGLGVDDLPTIGSAASLYHGALLLFDRDIRSAYTLLVAGVEVLSRRYGSPPSAWVEWEESSKWDGLFVRLGLTAGQASDIRDELFRNRQLRLKATFRTYGAMRLPDAFWDRPWEEWMYGIRARGGTWTDATLQEARVVRDVLSEDREALGRALGMSYDLRSKFVHRGAWIGPFELTLRQKVLADFPLPFSVLRAVLRELIDVELRSHARPISLPDAEIRIQRSPVPGS